MQEHCVWTYTLWQDPFSREITVHLRETSCQCLPAMNYFKFEDAHFKQGCCFHYI